MKVLCPQVDRNSFILWKTAHPRTHIQTRQKLVPPQVKPGQKKASIFHCVGRRFYYTLLVNSRAESMCFDPAAPPLIFAYKDHTSINAWGPHERESCVHTNWKSIQLLIPTGDSNQTHFFLTASLGRGFRKGLIRLLTHVWFCAWKMY